LATAVDDDTAYFGRVLKINMGRCVVNIWNHEKKRHMEVQARLPNKKKGIIRINDLVNLAPSHPDWEVQIAVDAKTVSDLRKSGRITAELATEASMGAGGKGAPSTEDLGIEFDYEGLEQKGDEEAEAAALAAAGAGKGGKKVTEDDEVDIDDI
jgi:hypothetical protein